MKLLVYYVDDSLPLLRGVKHELESSAVPSSGGTDAPFEVETFRSVSDYSRFLAGGSAREPDIALLDISLDGDEGAGLRLTELTRRRFPRASIVIFSQFDDGETVARYMSAGAHNFLSKTTPLEDLGRLLSAMAGHRPRSLPTEGQDAARLRDIVSRVAGETMTRVATRVPALLKSAVRAVHVMGETGTGKEVVADIFEHFLRAHKPFVRVNCGALAPTLLESELFGFRKGAFTGALQDKRGLLEAAHGGWIFLDEVALLGAGAQVALLRALENQEVFRVGETTPRKIDVRVLSATNEELERRVAEGSFRRDLWQRLVEAQVVLPPLRERTGEIEALVALLASRLEGGPYHIPKTTLEVLNRYGWHRGNVRELRNCLRAMTEFNINKSLEPNSIPHYIYQDLLGLKAPAKEAAVTIPVDFSSVRMDELEDALFLEVLRGLSQRTPLTSLRMLEAQVGIPRSTLARRLQRLQGQGKLDAAFAPLLRGGGISKGARLKGGRPEP